MSLSNLINVNTVLYSSPSGQNKVTGGLEYTAPTTIRGRLGEATTRFDTQEAQDQVSDASFSTFEILQINGRIKFEAKTYLIVNKHGIRRGDGRISHYNYALQSLDNAEVDSFITFVDGQEITFINGQNLTFV